MKNEKNISMRKRLYTSFLLFLLALVAITAATVAWFSIADKTRVKTMGLDITAGVDLKMDLDPHPQISQYVKTLTFEQIANRMQRDKGFSMETTPLEPVTTNNQSTFTYEDGTVVPDTKGSYLTFTLHFMAEKDMIVHLTSANSSANAQDGTLVSSKNPTLPEAMRISFTADGRTWVYDPGMGNQRSMAANASVFGLPPEQSMRLNENNALFSMVAGQDKTVLVHVWMEGTDPACTDALTTTDYSIRLRFEGETTEEN